MTTRRLSRFVAGTAFFALVLMFVLDGAAAAAGKRDKSAPTTPTNLTVTRITQTTVSLDWNASSDNSGKLSYRLKINNLANAAASSVATISQTQTAYSAKFLFPN